jgi:hypothetical protein
VSAASEAPPDSNLPPQNLSDEHTPPSLPDDVLRAILAYLAVPDLVAVTYTSRAYRDLALPFLYKTLSIGNKADVPAIYKFLKANWHIANKCVTTLRIAHHNKCACRTPYEHKQGNCEVWPRFLRLRHLELDLTDPRSRDKISNLETCIAASRDTSDMWRESSVHHVTLERCVVVTSQRPVSLLVRLNGCEVSEVLQSWGDLIPFHDDHVKRLVVVTDVIKEKVSRREFKRYPWCVC